MQILAGSHCKKNFKHGLGNNFVLHVHGILWAHSPVSYVDVRAYVSGPIHLSIHLRGVYGDHPNGVCWHFCPL